MASSTNSIFLHCKVHQLHYQCGKLFPQNRLLNKLKSFSQVWPHAIIEWYEVVWTHTLSKPSCYTYSGTWLIFGSSGKISLQSLLLCLFSGFRTELQNMNQVPVRKTFLKSGKQYIIKWKWRYNCLSGYDVILFIQNFLGNGNTFKLNKPIVMF